MAKRIPRALPLLVLVGASQAAAGCGPSQEDWERQLAKYEKLEQRYGQLEAELAHEAARVKELSDRLRAMGMKLDEEGTEKAALAKDLEEMKRALEEYKQRAATLERIKARFELLRSKLKKMTELGLDVSIRHNRMIISLPGDLLFAPGEDELSKKGQSVLRQVAQIIASDESLRQRFYQVAGHTDNEPLRRTAPKFKDNWGLSVMRARQVLVFLISPGEADDGGGGLDAKHWSASGYGEVDPIASNATPAGRGKNRRVELVLMPNVEEMLDLQSLAGADKPSE